jgi:hypothetical protein
MVLKVMKAKQMNYPVHYEDSKEETERDGKKKTVSAQKTVTWKSIVATPFKTLQRCALDMIGLVGRSRG